MSMYNVIEYSDDYSKTSGILWQYCRDERALDDDGDNDAFNEVNCTTNSFKIEEKITGTTVNNDTKNVEIMVPLKYETN